MEEHWCIGSKMLLFSFVDLLERSQYVRIVYQHVEIVTEHIEVITQHVEIVTSRYPRTIFKALRLFIC